MSTTLADHRAALATALETVAPGRVVDHIPDRVATPCIIVGRPTIDWPAQAGELLVTVTVPVLVVADGHPRAAQATLDDWAWQAWAALTDAGHQVSAATPTTWTAGTGDTASEYPSVVLTVLALFARPAPDPDPDPEEPTP